ncbi:hypothetical protein [Bittarella massiliensis (ex Durand et al. 2017)]|uniref:hypothetical protein n=1 Tax=Bittarella massiliensis (ex Durand et al. 2017) TaxID=1720313 RepID=UPI001AA13855|nr:hypothetical protein [Bittarella massiliensis (ex Durand et al. 2017)]MBO1680300.1 hypothetical protein [Bittarella massiliensis (ex Durand et al. 2017)]
MADSAPERFLAALDEGERPAAQALIQLLAEGGCPCALKEARSGPTLSFKRGGKGGSLAVFVCRKSGAKVRLYPQRALADAALLDGLPEGMKDAVRRAAPCKRLVGSGACNPRCPMGVSFSLDGQPLQLCRHTAFFFSLREETLPALKRLLASELPA